MSRTIFFGGVTLDGFIADDDDGIEWLTGFKPNYDGGGGSVLDDLKAKLERVGALVMGSATYEFILDASAWPYGDRPTWVMTSRELPAAEGADIRFHNGPVADIHPEMLAAAGERDLWLVGGGGLASDLLDAGLLDEISVTIVPVALGSGKPLFERPVRDPMRVLHTQVFSSGMIELVFAPAKP